MLASVRAPADTACVTLGWHHHCSQSSLVFSKSHARARIRFESIGAGSTFVHFLPSLRDPENWTPAAAVPHVGPAILLGLTTTLVGYLVLAAVPFPGLKQIAVFCMTGLIVGCGSVLCLYPVLARARGKLPRLGPQVGNAIEGVLRRWQWTTTRRIVLAGVAVVVALGLGRLQIQDDVKALQQSPPQLVAENSGARSAGSGIDTALSASGTSHGRARV